jgi:hypothetical protein
MRKENADTGQCNNRNDELKHGTILKQSVSLLIETLDAVLFQDDFVRAEFGFVQPIFEPERCFVANCNSRDTLNLTDIASSLAPSQNAEPLPRKSDWFLGRWPPVTARTVNRNTPS